MWLTRRLIPSGGWRWLLAALICGAWLATIPLSAQGSLSAQILQLLARDNTWTGTNAYIKGVALTPGVPAITTNTLYSTGGNLFWNGNLVTTAAGVGTVTSVGLVAPAIFTVTSPAVTGAGDLTFTIADQADNRFWGGPSGGGGGPPTFRALVDVDIPDTLTINSAGTVTWASVSKAGSSLLDLTTRSASDLSAGTLPDGRFPATLPALSGVNLTALNASSLGSGTVPCARTAVLTGDVTTAGCAATLASTGIVAGAYTTPNVTVDAKGRITAIVSAAAGAHNFLSVTHTDTLVAAAVRGSVVIANSTPVWAQLTPTTAGQILTYNGTDSVWSTSASALTGLNASNITSGTLAVAQGGTGTGTAPANGQLLIGNGATYTLANLTGTANQIVVTNGAGSITLTTPQGIGTLSTPQFARIGIGTGAGAQAGVLYGAAGPANAPFDDGNCGAADTVDFSVGSWHKVTLSAATCTLTFANPVTGSEYWIFATQDGAGSRLITWPTIRWSGGAAPTLTTGAAKVDIIACRYDGTSFFCRTEANY
jgi:hypothetical protein